MHLRIGTAPPTVDATGMVAIPVLQRTKPLLEAVRRLDVAGITLADVALRRPSLDEAFLSITGNKLNMARHTTSQIAWALSDVAVFTKHNLIRYKRIPQLLFFSTVQPIMFLLLFTFVFGGAINVGGGS